MAGARVLLAATLLAATPACFAPGDGREPPLREIYFPVGVAISPGFTRLYLANSDFDLQFNAGSVQAYDLTRLEALLPTYCDGDAACGPGQRCDVASHWCVGTSGPNAGDPCRGFGVQSAADRLLAPGLCGSIDPVATDLLIDQVGVGAFATDLVYRRDPSSKQARLFVPVRGDATLHWIDVDDDSADGPPRSRELECGQTGAEGSCDDIHRAGADPDRENSRDVRLPPEPFGVAIDDTGESIAMTHQADGAVSLFVNQWTSEGPALEFVLGGQPAGAVGVAALPEPAVVDLDDIFYQPGFLVTFRNEAQVRLYRYFSDEVADPARPFLQHSGTVAISANSVGSDSRGIAIDPAARQGCERTCIDDVGREPSEALTECQRSCAGVPLDVFVANRAPASLLVGRTRTNSSSTSSDDLPRFHDSIALSLGPSRVEIGDVIDEDGQPARRVFVVCFDSRSIFIIDPVSREVETLIRTGRGPHALAVERAEPAVVAGDGTVLKRASVPRGRAYLAHFTDSYLGVIDLDRRNRHTYGTIIASIGEPTPPRASK